MDFFHLLPKDLVVHNIIPRFDLTTWARIQAVSWTWRRLISQTSPSPPADMPWLWLPKNGISENFHLLSLRASTLHRSYPSREVTYGKTIGSCYQYVVQSFGHKIRLANPLTGQTFHLPSRLFVTDNLQITHVSHDPTSRQGCLVAIVENPNKLYVAIVGGDRWEKLAWLAYPKEIKFFKGLIYVAKPWGDIMGYGIRIPQARNLGVNVKPFVMESYIHGPLEPGYRLHELEMFLAECCEELLLIVKFERKCNNILRFSVYRVYIEHAKMVKVDDLEDYMLFLGKGCSKSWFWPLPAMSSNFFTKNCVYFVYHGESENCTRLGKYCLRQNKLEASFALYKPIEMNGLPYFCTNPFWITPNPIS